jgi:hypothetical protein
MDSGQRAPKPGGNQPVGSRPKRGPIKKWAPATSKDLAKVAPLSPEMIALRGHLGDAKLDEKRVKLLYFYTHPKSPSRGRYAPSVKAAGLNSKGDMERATWFKSEPVVLLINKCVMYWAETLAERTAMDNINDRHYEVAMFDMGTTVRKRQDGFLEVQDFTKINTRAIEEIYIDTTRKDVTDKDGNVTSSITNQKVRIKAYSYLAAAREFAINKGERNKKLGNSETPHRLLIQGVRGMTVSVDMGDGKDPPIDVTPTPAQAIHGPTQEEREPAGGPEPGGPAD